MIERLLISGHAGQGGGLAMLAFLESGVGWSAKAASLTRTPVNMQAAQPAAARAANAPDRISTLRPLSEIP